MDDRERREQLALITEAGLDLQRLIEGLGASREAALAATSAELAVMWARRHLEKEALRDAQQALYVAELFSEEEPPAAA